MGNFDSYLGKPITEKESSDESNDRLICGASAMQGWRESQEDAHNCILDFDDHGSFFAVYDGHGGHEVAHYASQNLPNFLKDLDSYKKGEYEKAFEEAFLGFDATIITPKILALLKSFVAERKQEERGDDDVSEEEENVNNLYEEATMPIEQVIEKYTKKLMEPHLKNSDKQPTSPSRKEKLESSSATSSSSDATDGVSSSSSSEAVVEVNSSDNSGVSKTKNGTKVPEIHVHSPDSSADNVCSPSTDVVKKPAQVVHQNGDVSSADSKTEDVTSASAPVENGEASKKGKGKALTKTKGVEVKTAKSRPRRTVKQIYAKLLDFEDSDDSEDEEDETFEEPKKESSDDENCVNSSITEEESSDEEEEDDEDDDDDDDESEEEINEASLEFAKNMRYEPGYNSGCTAVVALLKGNKLYVANAGDSRCIVCRNGKAVDMSVDHKPDDQLEYDRVKKAGGNVYAGRVNDGLNLSRAIGDHYYKQNKELSDKEQMITALPDVMTITINPPEDEFMVLACDGIWNFMESQEVVDFVRPAILEGKKLSKICEEMFTHCLAPNTIGDGTGCDNMTAIIVQFKSLGLKRASSPDQETSGVKRAKTDEVAPKEAEKSS